MGKYGNINVVEEDTGVVSTQICRACYSLVKGIMEKIEKFSNICKGSCEEKDCLVQNLEMKRSVSQRSPFQVAISPSVLPQAKRSRHPQNEQTLHTRARVSLFQSRPILSKPAHPANSTPSLNVEVTTVESSFYQYINYKVCVPRDQYCNIYVVVQFDFWFNFDFTLFFSMLMYDNEYQTKENQN